MSKSVCKKLGSPKLTPSPITLRAYDGHPLAPIGLFQDVPVEIAIKTVPVDIEFLDAQLDYNILLGRSNMYYMTTVASLVFCVIIFPNDGKMFTIN